MKFKSHESLLGLLKLLFSHCWHQLNLPRLYSSRFSSTFFKSPKQNIQNLQLITRLETSQKWILWNNVWKVRNIKHSVAGLPLVRGILMQWFSDQTVVCSVFTSPFGIASAHGVSWILDENFSPMENQKKASRVEASRACTVRWKRVINYHRRKAESTRLQARPPGYWQTNKRVFTVDLTWPAAQ